MEIPFAEFLTVGGIALAIGGTVYATRHTRRFASERMVIAYFGIGISVVGYLGPKIPQLLSFLQ